MTSWHRTFITLPISIAIDEWEQQVPLASIYSLLAAIGQFLHVTASSKILKPNDNAFLKNELTRTTNELSQMVVYPLPISTGTQPTQAETKKEDIINSQAVERATTIDLNHQDAFFSSLTSWCASSSMMKSGLPVDILGKISSRFFTTIGEIDYGKDEGLYLGHLLHRYIIAFLNSVLVEERLYQNEQDGQDLLLRNPAQTDHVFLQNLQNFFKQLGYQWDDLQQYNELETPQKQLFIDKVEQAAPLFTWLCACPVWLIYLDSKQKQLFNIIKLIVGVNDVTMLEVSYHEKKSIFPNLFTPLNSLLLQRSDLGREEKHDSLIDDDKKFIHELFAKPSDALKKTIVDAMHSGNKDLVETSILRVFFEDRLRLTKVPQHPSKFRQEVESFIAKQWDKQVKIKK